MIGTVPYDRNSITGGVEAVVANLIEGFRSADESISLIVVSRIDSISEIIIEKISNSIAIHYVPKKNGISFFNDYYLESIIEKHNPDILHVQGTGIHLIKYLKYSINTVVTQHGISWKEFRSFPGIKKYKLIMHAIIDIKKIGKAKNIIFISYIGRAPNDRERELLKDASYGDIVWILINSHEFKLIS